MEKKLGSIIVILIILMILSGGRGIMIFSIAIVLGILSRLSMKDIQSDELSDKDFEIAQKMFKSSKWLDCIIVIIFLGLLFLGIFLFLARVQDPIQSALIYPSKLPLLIQYSTGFVYLPAVFLLISLSFFCSILLAKIVYRKNYEFYLKYDFTKRIKNKNNYAISPSVLRAISFFFGIILILSLIGIFVGLDDYLIANENGIYYNPLFSYWEEKYYRWDEVENIFFETATIGMDGKIHEQDSPYYFLKMKNGDELPPFFYYPYNGTIVEDWVKIIQEKSGAEIYIKYGNQVTKKQ